MKRLWKIIPSQGTESPDTHAELFVQHYARLLEWALRLTGNDRQRAEDLVQDAFVLFTFGRADLSTIQNLEGYLYGMLRNINRLELRRAAHSRSRLVSI